MLECDFHTTFEICEKNERVEILFVFKTEDNFFGLVNVNYI